MAAACIEISKLTKCYGANVAVSGLSLEVQTGEVFGLLGPNGAGKSTTLHMMCGLVRPTSGGVAVFGRDLRRHFVKIAPRMGVLVERPTFYTRLSVRRNLLLLDRLAGHNVSIGRTLDLVGLLHVQSKKVYTLSAGMRQRLGLAQALLGEPELLILDEPANGLDVEATRETLRLLRRLADDAKVTIVISSHMLHEVESLCDRVAVINSGRLVACDLTDALLSYDQSRVEVLLDAPESAAKRLTDMPWIESVEVKPGRIDVRLKDGSIHQLNAFLVGAGYRISGVIPRRRTLQDFFLKVLNA